ncbi:hypothetical protein, conserved [Leishmania tarentolae]|uniref:A-kinase anchor protein 7-like phosphoesterase domain-containing protein n=1 Tax=Leishmania tarentolae TaxID=5689 RepID=A0A640KNW8_LEITA|nr:hypothetical protein, conserved [Leishmania tarentolae]
MWMRCSRVLRGRAERGLYFPINHRIVDQRNSLASGAEEADIQSRYRRQLRSSFVTREMRQTEPPAWSQRVRPTHFLSLPLPARCTLQARMKEMHESMIFANQSIEQLLIPASKLHVTLGVMTIGGEKSTEEATSACAAPDVLAAIHDCIDQACHDACKEPLQLRFRGLGTFRHGRVLFAVCVTEAHFTRLDALVRRIRRDVGLGLGVDMKGNPHDSYVPHVTIAKIRPSQIGQFGRQIPMSMWVDHQHNDFGDVTFNRVDLCSMKGEGKNGYYHVVSSVSVQ